MTARSTIAAIRFGFGLPVPAGAPETPEAMLALLAGPDTAAAQWPIVGMADLEPEFAKLELFQKAKSEKTLTPELTAQAEALAAMPAMAMRLTFARALDAPDGFRERLVSFWADHFTTVESGKYAKMLPYALVEDAIRPNLTGSFADLLTAVTLHPAMLSFLDQSASVGPNSILGKKKGKGLNENLARELMELHSLGVGASYSQDDVTQMAKLLTGLTYVPTKGMVFDDRRAEPGAENVLGKTYPGDGVEPVRAMLADLAARPETAAHIAGKLAVHFVSDTPDPDLVAAISAAYLASSGDLMACYGAMLQHPAAWGGTLEKVRQPYDLIAAALRALGATGAQVVKFDKAQLRTIISAPMGAMGQPFKLAKGPNGFPEEPEAWITPQGLAHRISWAMQVPERVAKPLPDPLTLVQTCLADQASADLLWAVERAEDQKQGVGLVLASADFNRR